MKGLQMQVEKLQCLLLAAERVYDVLIHAHTHTHTHTHTHKCRWKSCKSFSQQKACTMML
jgi:hypothetical protein